MYISEQKESKCTIWNEDVNGNRKLFWKEVSNVKGGKVKSSSTIKNGDGRLAEGSGRSILKNCII